MYGESGSRRAFMRYAASLLGTSWLASHAGLLAAAAGQAQQALATSAPFKHLKESEALTLAALCDQIFPPDEPDEPDGPTGATSSPGASELGAVQFIDVALGGFMAGALPAIREGLADLDSRAGTSSAFHQLGFDQQTELVRQIQDTAFFANVHFLTLCGLFAMPSYGGNTGGAAWKVLGYEPRHHWKPPFGYYDARYAEEQGSVEA